MSSKLLSQAHRTKSIRDSGLFEHFPSLSKSLLVAIANKVHILFSRESRTYYFVSVMPESGYELLTILPCEKMLKLDELITIADKLIMEEVN